MAKKQPQIPKKPTDGMSKDQAGDFYYAEMAAQTKPDILKNPVYQSLLHQYSNLCAEEDYYVRVIGDNPTYIAENRYGAQHKPVPEIQILARLRSQKTSLGLNLMKFRSRKSTDGRADLFGKS